LGPSKDRGRILADSMKRSADEGGVEMARRQYEQYVDATQEFRARAELRRDYYDGKQWTSDEAQVLRDRKQAPIVINRIAPKVDFLVGLEQQTRTDPKAYPRTPKHEQGAEAATDALRYLEEISELDLSLSDGFCDLCIEGTEAYLVNVEKKRGQAMPTVQRIPWDRFYHDPRARMPDFSDATFLGLTAWMNKEAAKRIFPKKAEEIEVWCNQGGNIPWEANEDRPVLAWWDSEDERIRINQHYYLDESSGKWMVCYFAGDLELMPVKVSPYVDEDGEPSCPIIARSVFITRENERYGVVERLIGIQDEINHRRSKALHMLSATRVWAQKGVFADPSQVISELRKATGMVEAAGVFGSDWGLLPNSELAQGQLVLAQDAKAEIDAVGANAALTGKDDRALSGRALQQRSQSGTTELGPIFDAHRAVKLRIYRALWMRVRQFWTDETWIRVTDDERNVRFVGLNKPVTHGEKLQQAGIAPINPNDPQLGLVVERANEVERMDVDIRIEDAPDTISIQQEQFEVVAQLAQAQPQNAQLFEMVIELSTLRNKDKVLERLKGGSNPEQQQAMQAQMQAQQEAQAARVQRDKAAAIKDVSTAAKNNAEAAATHGQMMAAGMQAAAPMMEQAPA
jgi:hypothetical protein